MFAVPRQGIRLTEKYRCCTKLAVHRALEGVPALSVIAGVLAIRF
jgi:hypothetical protein